MSDDTTGNDRTHIGGKTFETTQESTTTPEEMTEINAAFAAFEKSRDAVPENERFRLSDRFGGQDFDGTEFEEWVEEQQSESPARNKPERS